MLLLSNSRDKKNIFSNNFLFHIIALFIYAFILTVLPVPESLSWIWPQWVLLLVIYKVITNPYKYGIVFAFVTGLIYDLLVGSKLGMHGLSYCVISYSILKIHQRIYLFPVLQQSLLVFVLVLLDFVFIYVFSSSVELDWMFVGHAFLSSTLTAAIWLFYVGVYGLKQKLSRI